MTTPQISNYPFIAEILFRDGSSRRIECDQCCMSGGFLIYIIGTDEATRDEVYVNAATVQTVDLVRSAQPQGRA